jgi:hypothetical protein
MYRSVSVRLRLHPFLPSGTATGLAPDPAIGVSCELVDFIWQTSPVRAFHRCLWVVMAGVVLCKCSTSAVSSPMTHRSTSQEQVLEVLSAVKLPTVVEGRSCTDSGCTSFPSPPLSKKLDKAADRLAAIRIPPANRTQVNALVTALRKAASDYRQLSDHHA